MGLHTYTTISWHHREMESSSGPCRHPFIQPFILPRTIKHSKCVPLVDGLHAVDRVQGGYEGRLVYSIAVCHTQFEQYNNRRISLGLGM